MRSTFGSLLNSFPTAEGIGRRFGKRTPRFIQDKIKRNKKGVEIDLTPPEPNEWDERINEIVDKVKKEIAPEEFKREELEQERTESLKELVANTTKLNRTLTISNRNLMETNKDLMGKVDKLVEMVTAQGREKSKRVGE